MTCVKCLGQRLTHRLRSPVMTGYYEGALQSHEFFRIASLRIVDKTETERQVDKEL